MYTAISIMKHGDSFQGIHMNCEIKIAKGDKFKLQLPLSSENYNFQLLFFFFFFVISFKVLYKYGTACYKA